MTNKASQDPILDAFKEGKESQMDLFADEKQEAAPVVVPVQEPAAEVKEEVRTEAPEEPAKREVMHTGYDGVEYTEEEWHSPVVRNGPTRREVEGWKERYDGRIFFVPFDGDAFVFRALDRPEYREIIRDTTLTALDREEMFTEKCVLFPYNFSIDKIKKSRAGIASLLSEMIMDKSGFVAQSAPIKL